MLTTRPAPSSIRAQLAAMIALASLPVAVFVAIDYPERIAGRTMVAELSAREVAGATAAAIGRLVDDERAVLAAVAARPAQRGERAGACDPLLADFLALAPHRANINVLSASGEVVCAAIPPPPGATASMRGHELMQRLLRTGEFTVGEPIVGPISGRWVTPLAYPRRDGEGRLIGWVGAPLDLARASELVGALRSNTGDEIGVFSGRGLLVAGSAGLGGLIGADLGEHAFVRALLGDGRTSWHGRGLDGTARVWGTARVPGTDWTVVAGVERAAWLAPVEAVMLRNAVLYGSTLLLVGFLCYRLGRQIDRPMRALAETARRVGAGDRSARVRPSGPREIVGIATGFNAMLDALDRVDAQRRRLAQAIDQTSDFIALSTAEGRIVYANRAARALLGLRASDPLDGVGAAQAYAPGGWEAALGTARPQALAQGLWSGETLLRAHDGRDIPVMQVVVPLRDERGEVDCYAAIARDISERVGAERALRDSESRLRNLFDQAADGIFLVTPDHRFLDANAEALRMLGYTRDELLRLHVADVLAESERPRLETEVPAIMAGAPHFAEWVMRRRDGTTFPAEASARAHSPEQYIAIVRDLTARRETERHLRESAERFEKIFVAAPEAMSISDMDSGFLLHVNDAFCDTFGHPREALVGRTSMEAGLWTVPGRRGAIVSALRAGRPVRSVEGQTRRGSGEVRDVLISAEAIVIDDERRLLLMFTDVTERKRAESALQESAARLRLLIAASGVGLWDWNLVTNDVYFSPEWKRQLGFADDELPSRYEEWESRLHPEDRQTTLAAVRAFIEGRRTDYEIEFRLRHRDGRWRWILTRADLARGADGKPLRMMGCQIDITERRQVAENLRRTGEVLRLFVEHSPAAIAMLDREMRYIVASRRYLADYGISEPDVVGRSHYDVFPEMPERWIEVHQRCLAGAIERADDDPFPRADGRVDWVRWEIRPWREADGAIGGIILFSEVVTARHLAAATLRESQARLEALTHRLLDVQEAERRALARELHDEVGGVLTAVKLNLQSLARRHVGDAALGDGLALVDGAIQAVRSLSLDLRPSVLDDLGLIPALNWYCERQAQRSDVPIERALDAIDLESAPQLETACFRIVQEAVTNALRHGNPRGIRVALRRGDGEFLVEIADDGGGFDVAAARARSVAGASSGLLSMEERAVLLGGRFAIASTPATGTRVSVKFDLPVEEPA